MSSKNQKLRASITIGSVIEGSVKKNIGILKSGLSQVGAEIKKVEKRQRELAKQRKVLEKEGRAVDALDREYAQLERQLGDLRRAQERWQRAATSSRKVGQSFRAMTSDIGRQARRMAVGVGLASGAIFGLAASTASLGDDVAKTADKLGISIEALQELRYAAERSGVSTEQFDSALEKMTKNLGEAVTGTGTAKDALDQLGLSAADLIEMEPEEALGLIADRMDGVATQAEKAAIANDLFGRSGIGMINMLRGGSDGLRQLREDARRTGYVLSEEAARDAEVFQDTLLDTQLALKGLKNTVGAELLPVVTDAMRKIGDALIENREEVEAWSESFAQSIENAIPIVGQLVEGIGKVGSVVWDVVAGTADLVGGWENFGIAIGAVLAGKTVAKIGIFAANVFKLGRAMAALMLATGPVGAAIALLGAAAITVITNWDKVKASVGAVLDWMGQKLEWLMGKMQPIIDGLAWLGEKGGAIADGVGSYFNPDQPSHGSAGRAERRNTTKKAVGGAYQPGWLLTGERGPELNYESRGGYIAHNRALRQMASMGQKAAQVSTAAAGAISQTVTQNITINAMGASAAEVVRELERQGRQKAAAALYDRAPATGPFGR